MSRKIQDLLKTTLILMKQYLKCPYSQQGFYIYSSYNVLKGILRKKIGFWDFNALRYRLKVPVSATPNEVDHVMKDWWGMTSLQEYMYLKALYFYFACLTTALLRQLHSVCFLLRKTYHHYWKGFCDSWLYYYYYYYLMRLTTHSETQILFWTDSRSISLGVAEVGALNLDLKTLKSPNPIFFLRTPFNTL